MTDQPPPATSATSAAKGGPPPARRRPWRAWNTFLVALAGAFLAFLAFIATAFVLNLRQGTLTDAQAHGLLGLLYWGTYPLVFVALAALLWHSVRFYRGDYARR